MEIDIRDTDLAIRDGMVTAVTACAESVCAQRGISLSKEVLNADPPATCAPLIVGAIGAAARECGASQRRLVSRAYHDSLFMARIAPTAMIFIPCRNGVSHRPDEYSTPKQISLGVEVLARTLARLSSQTTPLGGTS